MHRDVLRGVRKFSNLSQRALAEKAAIDFWRLSRFERGLGRLTADEQRRLVDALPMLAKVLGDARDAALRADGAPE
jgi:transcriptional regulator with XRE-family HTH domain